MKNHEKAFAEIKNYYNDITLNNLALINALKVGMRSALAHLLRLEKPELCPLMAFKTSCKAMLMRLAGY